MGRPAEKMAWASTMSSAPNEEANTASGWLRAMFCRTSCNTAHELAGDGSGAGEKTALMIRSLLHPPRRLPVDSEPARHRQIKRQSDRPAAWWERLNS